MIRINAESIMPKRPSVVCAGFVIAISLAAAPARGRQVHGGDVARFLTGKAFSSMLDGTTGAVRSEHGVAKCYRRPSDRERRDKALSRQGRPDLSRRNQFGGAARLLYGVRKTTPLRLSTGRL